MSLGMDREYLIKGFEDEIVQAYYNYMVDMAVIYGAERFNAELDMKDVINFEMALANVRNLFFPVFLCL
jgi:membrane metallo-endopeptidase-like protein 1